MAETTPLQEVTVQSGPDALGASLAVPASAAGMVVFAHGSGSSRMSPRNRAVAAELNRAGLGTLLLDLLTMDEQRIDERTRHLRFDIELLGRRLVGAIDWLNAQEGLKDLRAGLFGASTGAAAALVAAARKPSAVHAVVSRGGRPDLAGEALPRVEAPTLLIVGGLDVQVIELNRQAAQSLRAVHRIEIVPGASHLFEEPGTLEEVSRLAGEWFLSHLGPPQNP